MERKPAGRFRAVRPANRFPAGQKDVCGKCGKAGKADPKIKASTSEIEIHPFFRRVFFSIC